METPGLLWGLWQWQWKSKNKTKKKWFLLLKWLSQAHVAHSQGAPLSLSSSRLIRLDILSLSWQADTEDWSLVVFVLYSWLSFVCGTWLTALGSFFFCLLFSQKFTLNLSSVFSFRLRSRSWFLPQVTSTRLFSPLSLQGDISCCVCTSDYPCHLKQNEWIK